MKLKLYCLFLLYSLTAGGLLAQHVLKGEVVGKSDQQAFPGATVIANGNSTAVVITDADGQFTINLGQPTGQLTVSFIGMKTVTVPYDAAQFIKIELEEEISALNEIVVIGYGTSKRQDLTTSVSSLDNVSKAVDRPVSSAQAMLQGQMAGVTVVSNSGDPGATPSVMIRGRGTFNSEEPLYVVDGMPYYGARINPNDIESISVLKDAAAAAIYGAQAASGVIVITTKSGKSGAPKVAFDFYQGWQSAYKTPQALTAPEYAQAYTQAAEHAGTTPNPAHDPSANPWGQVQRTNWMDEIFQTGAITNANIQFSGGSDRSRFSSSFGYHKKEGLLLNTEFEMFSLRLKSDFDLTEKLRVGQNIYMSHSAAFGANTNSSYSGAIINAIYMNPAAPVYDEFGKFHGTVPFELSQFAGAYGDTYNPVGLLLRPTRKAPRLNLNASAFAEYDILENLTFKSTFSIDLWNYRDKTFSPRSPEIGRPSNMNFLDQSSGSSSRWIWDQQLNYFKRFGKHNLSATLVYTAQYRTEESSNYRVQDFDREDDWFQDRKSVV